MVQSVNFSLVMQFLPSLVVKQSLSYSIVLQILPNNSSLQFVSLIEVMVQLLTFSLVLQAVTFSLLSQILPLEQDKFLSVLMHRLEFFVLVQFVTLSLYTVQIFSIPSMLHAVIFSV